LPENGVGHGQEWQHYVAQVRPECLVELVLH
jgi:hypothetical protein